MVGGSGDILLAAAVEDVVLLVRLRFDGRNMLSLPFLKITQRCEYYFPRSPLL